MIVERLTLSNKKEALDFLKASEDYTLFLLGNLEAYGPALGEAPYSGNYKLIRVAGKVVAVFCLTKAGNLLVQAATTEEQLLDRILEACREEAIPIKGLMGEWAFCQTLWSLMKKRGLIREEKYVEKEVLYTVDLQGSYTADVQARNLQAEDYIQWKPMCLHYLEERGMPNGLTDEQRYRIYLGKIKDKLQWGYFRDKELISMGELNACAMGVGLVGGIYTSPSHRKKGYAKIIMDRIFHDAKETHGLHKLIIFTGETNHPARKLYESLGVDEVGHFALLFGH